MFTLGLMVAVNGIANSLIFILSLSVHEWFHYIFARLLGVKLNMPLVGIFGMRFETKFNDAYGLKWALIYLSGALGNAVFAIFIILTRNYIYIPNSDMFIFHNLLLAFINLIPAFPLDMARALCCLLNIKYTNTEAVKVISCISELIAFIMFSVGAYIFIFQTDNMVLMIFSVMIFYYTGKERRMAQTEFIKSKLNRIAVLQNSSNKKMFY